MKKLLIAFCIFGLVGCMTVPVTQNFPKASDTLQTPPPALKEMQYQSFQLQLLHLHHIPRLPTRNCRFCPKQRYASCIGLCGTR